MHQTIIDLLRTADQDALALGGIGRPALTFRELIAQAEATVAALNSRGIGRNDRVAIVLPNGPEMASAFLSVGCGATTAPPGTRRAVKLARTSEALLQKLRRLLTPLCAPRRRCRGPGRTNGARSDWTIVTV